MAFVRSGNTRDMEIERNNWYLEEKFRQEEGEYYLEWEDFYKMESPKRLLEKMVRVPFYKYFLHYIVIVFRVELEMEDFLGLGQKDQDAISRYLIREAKEHGKKSKAIQQLAQLMFQSFQQNGFGIPEEPDKIYGKLSGEKAVTKNELVKVLVSQECSAERLAWLALGLNMDGQTVDLFLRKALLRAGWNIWDPKEFLLYLCTHYPSGQKRKFYQQLEREMEQIASVPWEIGGIGNRGTMMLEGEMDALIHSIYGEQKWMQFYEPGTEILDPKLEEMIGKYKYLLEKKGKHRRSALIVCNECLDSFEILNEESIRSYIESYRNSDEYAYAQGKVNVYFDSAEMEIPKGTIFYTKAGEAFYTKEAQKAVFDQDAETSLVIEVECSEEAIKSKTPETENGYVKKHTKFFTNVEGVIEASNRSGLKTPGKTKRTSKVKARTIEIGEVTRVQGKLQITCKYGTEIKEGDVFIANQKRYLCKKGAKCDLPFLTVNVFGKREEIETEKNTLIRAEFPDGTSLKYKRIEHSKIKIQVGNGSNEEEERKGGPVYRYLYAHQEAGRNSNLDQLMDLEDLYKERLKEILQETKFSASRLNIIRHPEQIEKDRNTNKALMTRAEVLVLAFLGNDWDKMDEDIQRYKGSNNQKIRKEIFEKRFLEFKDYADWNLQEAGFYPLYLVNPLDAFLTFLTVFDEPINMLRNLLNEYL